MHPTHALPCSYLVDRANLLLFLDGPGASRRGGGGGQQQRLLSLQEATDLMVACGVPMDRYLVFAKLLRAGYIVTRHPARWALGPADDLATAAAAARAWGRAPADAAAATAAAAGQPQPGGEAAAAQQAKPLAAIPAGPPRKRRRAEARQHGGKWWVGMPVAATTEAPEAAVAAGAAQAQEGGGGGAAPLGGGVGTHGAAGNPWLAGMPAGFLDSLPRCDVLPTPAQRAAADFPRMAPLAAIPLGELRLPGGDAAGRHLLVSTRHGPQPGGTCIRALPAACCGSVRAAVHHRMSLHPATLPGRPSPPCPAAALRCVCRQLTLWPQAAWPAGVHGGGAALLAAPHARHHGSR